MMKKLLVFILSAMMAMSLVACGGDDTETDAADQQVENEADVDVEEETDDVTDEVEVPFLTFGVEDPTQMEHMEMPEIAGSTWAFCGGFNDGVEFTQEIFTNSLEAYGGVCNFVFNEDGTTQLVQGGGAIEGVYEYKYDENDTCVGVLANYIYDGGELTYAFMYTEVNGASILIGLDPTFTNGMYLIYVE